MSVFLIFFIAVSLSLTIFSGCSKDDQCPDQVNAEFTQKGLHGCSWLIKLDDGSYLEPVNMGDFEILPEEGLSILVSYHQSTDYGSFCMMGEIVEIDCITPE